MDIGYNTIYIMYRGTEKSLSEKFGLSLKIVFGINSPANKIKIVEMTDCKKNNHCFIADPHGNKRFKQNSHLQTVNNQGDIVADQHR